MPTWDSLMPVVGVTLRLAAVTTAVLLAVGTPLAWWLARRTGFAKDVVAALVALPLVLPPTVLGFYLLILLGERGPVGGVLAALGLDSLVFTFSGLVVGSVVYSLPFVVQPLQVAFEAVGARPLEAAATLRAGPLDRFFTVAAPLARTGFLTAIVLGFAHTIGEFGVVLMLGGSIPGRTRVLSIAIFEHVEASEYPQAHAIAAGMLGFALLVLIALHGLNRRLQRVRP
jgi:molybdate transport system permease protein